MALLLPTLLATFGLNVRVCFRHGIDCREAIVPTLPFAKASTAYKAVVPAQSFALAYMFADVRSYRARVLPSWCRLPIRLPCRRILSHRISESHPSRVIVHVFAAYALCER